MICNLKENCLRSKSTYGVFSCPKAAIDAVKKNDGNMFECFYTFAVVERYEVDKSGFAKELAWLQLRGYDGGEAEIEPCEKPPQYLNVKNFSIG